ncbi:MAG: hypothetical protein HUJ31_16255 [Pseudomonadales bacterium]|nr:hypothetical protein [Pseudomonadales bacterium]
MSENASSTPPDPSKANDRFALRLSLAVLIPILLTGILFTPLLSRYAYNKLEAQGHLTGQAIADQLAVSLTDHLVSRDILSLNVVLSDLMERGNFDFASVYSADNRLLAQAGRRDDSDRQLIFTRDVTFQNATAGYVQVGFYRDRLYTGPTLVMVAGLLIYGAVAGIVVLLIFARRNSIRHWLLEEGQQAPEPPPQEIEEPGPTAINTEETEIRNVCVLVVRIRPARLLDTWRGKIGKALSLYGGVLTESDGDDISAVFSTHDQVFQALCGGLLVKSMINRIGPPMKFTAAIHNAPANDSSVARKHASYLASITENVLLTSQRVYGEASSNDKVKLQEFHSSLTPDGEVYSVTSLSESNQVLIDRQAARLVQG